MKKLILIHILLCFSITSIADDQINKLRKKIFADKINEAACVRASRGLQLQLSHISSSLDVFLKKVIKHVQKRDSQALAPLFHPRLKIKKAQLEKIFNNMAAIYKEPINISIYRVWAFNIPKADGALIPCFEDEMAIGPHYGYTLQLAMWMQIMGQKELGRIYTSVVPHQNAWYLGSWHVQQWTHLGKDPKIWIDEALKDYENKQKLAAYLKLDLAVKLMNGGGYVFLKLREDALTTRRFYIPDAQWLPYIQDVFGSKVVDATSLLAIDGVGLSLSFQVDPKLTTAQMRTFCHESLKDGLKKIDYLNTDLGGIKCNFLNEQQVKLLESQNAVLPSLGSIFLSRQKIMEEILNNKAASPSSNRP